MESQGFKPQTQEADPAQAPSLPERIKRRTRVSLRFDYFTRVRVGALLLVFFSLLSSWGLFNKSRKNYNPLDDYGGHQDVVRYERRFDAIKRELSGQGIVGYVSDMPPYNAEFYMTQYALAPVIVDPTKARQLMVGNFSFGAIDVSTVTYLPLTLRGDYGNGVKLFSYGSR